MRRVGAFALVAILAVGACKRSSGESALPPASGSGVAPPDVPRVSDLVGESASPDAGGDPTSQSGTGTLYPKESAELGPKASGQLSAVLVKEGDKVKKGQVVFRLDSSQAALGVRQAQTLLSAAEVGLRAAEVDQKRTKELYDRGSVAPATYDQVQTRYDNAKAAVDQAKVALSMAQKQAADSVVHSPIAGVVTAKLKNVGETVTMMPPTVVLVVQDISVLELRVRLPERTLRTLVPGSLLTVKLSTLGEERTVPVKRINPAVDMLTRTVEVIADLDNADGKLRPGMLAEVAIGDADAGPGEPAADGGGAKAK
jgi:RND family efflux transporter MFP subunit